MSPIIQGEPTPAPRPAVCVLRVAPADPVEGSAVQFEATFTVDGQPHDPPSVICKLRAPGGQLTVEPAAQTAAGVYTIVVLLDQPGLWAIRVAGALGEGVVERELFVRASSF